MVKQRDVVAGRDQKSSRTATEVSGGNGQWIERKPLDSPDPTDR